MSTRCGAGPRPLCAGTDCTDLAVTSNPESVSKHDILLEKKVPESDARSVTPEQRYRYSKQCSVSAPESV